MKQNTKLLFILISLAFLVRIFVIWIGRPEFVGWFNHTYYYYVETKGLLENGVLPFPDMPLLFYIYALTSKLLIWLGVDFHAAIVIATRFWMSLIPLLLPIAVYATFKDIYKKQTLPKWIWVFIFASAFYPLSILHMPEFLQKNVLGLLLLAILMQQSRVTLDDPHAKRFIALLLIFLLIVLTHFGSTGAALLFLTAMILSLLIHKRNRWIFGLFLSLIFGLGLSMFAFYLFDAQRFERIGYYINRILDSSSVGLVFSPNSPDRFAAILMLVVPLGIIALLYYWYKSAQPKLSYENSIFWLANIIFSYLLLLPIYEPLLMARFVNFMGLPFIFVLAFLGQYVVTKPWIKKTVLAITLFGTLFIAFGDISNLVRQKRNNEVVHQDLMKMKRYIRFNTNDLIITRNGAEHICNWFLDTKSCLITSFNLNDLQKYDRVFILNPTEGNMRLQNNSNEAIQKYNYMLSNIQIPENVTTIYESPHMRLYRIQSAPEAWKFDKMGHWNGYEE